MNNNTDFWTKLQWPAAPNEDDYRIFAQYAHGRTLLLGSTKLLLPLCTEAWDIEPRYPDHRIQARDWFTLNEPFDTIMIDGGLAYGEEFCKRLLDVVLPNCTTFIARAFLNPNWKTTYAVYFPRAYELYPVPEEHPVNDIYTFYIWNKDRLY